MDSKPTSHNHFQEADIFERKQTMNVANTYQTLHAIYNKHRRKYRGNPDSKQMCCMWSTNNPPDTLSDTRPIYDIEDAFSIEINEDEAVEIYDMNLDEAIKKIMEMKKIQK